MKRFVQRWRLWLLLAAALLAVGVALAWRAVQERQLIAEREQDRLVAQSKVIEANLTRQLTAVNQVLQVIKAGLPSWQRDGMGLDSGLNTLKNLESSMTAVRTFLVTDAQGNITLSNRKELIGRNFLQRDYVQVPLKTLDPARLYVSPPFETVLHQYVINLTRLRQDAAGQFAGVVSAALDPIEIEILLNSVRYADDMQVTLLHGDGKVFIQQPVLPQPGSRDAAGEVRLTVSRTIAPPALVMDKPLRVVLARNESVLMEPWRHSVANQAVGYALLLLVCVAALSVYQRQRRQSVVAAKRLQLATQASGVGIWEFDLVTKRYYWDAAMFALFGLNPQQANARNDDWRQLLPAADLLRMRDATRLTIHQDQPFDMVFQITRPDGAVRFMRNHAALYADDHGVPRRLIGASEDITEHRTKEADLRVAAVAFESHESTLVTNAKVEILRVNQAFCTLFGYTASEVIGCNPRLLKSTRHDAQFHARLWANLLAQRAWQGEIWNLRKNGTELLCWLTITAVVDDAGVVTHYVATHTDITQRKAAQDEVKRLAFYDPLTSLPNRRLLSDRLQQALSQARRDKAHLALMFVDLDRFKPVNDRYGHAAGDMLLQAVALRLRGCVRESDTVARVGGDEFVVLLSSIAAAPDAIGVAEKIHAALRRPFALLGGVEVTISSSTGIALYPEHGTDEVELSHHADVAMYAAKGAGRDQFRLFQPDDAPAAPVLPVL